MKTLPVLCLIFVCMFSLWQCKKDKKDEPAASVCKLTQLNYESGFVVDWPIQTYEYQDKALVKIQFKDSNQITKVYEQYQYDAEGKLFNIKEYQNMGSGFTQAREYVFTYENKKIKSLAILYIPLQMLAIDSCEYNAAGQLARNKRYNGGSGGVDSLPAYTESFVYNSQGDLAELWMKGQTDTASYKQKVYTYSTEKNNLNQMPRKSVYPASVFCLTSMQTFQPNGSSGQPWIYSYLFDDKKNIVRITETVSSRSNVSHYRYQCN